MEKGMKLNYDTEILQISAILPKMALDYKIISTENVELQKENAGLKMIIEKLKLKRKDAKK